MARRRRMTPEQTGEQPAGPAPTWLRWCLPLSIVGSTAVTFLPVLANEFVWDDYPLFVENAFVHGLGPRQLAWIFTSLDTGHYHPLSWLVLGALYSVVGLAPMGYHLVGLLLHIANALMVYALTLRLIAVRSPAWFKNGDWLRANRQQPREERIGARCLSPFLNHARSPARNGAPRESLVVCAWLAAMAFALHPLRVEVVAWAIALRDLLCATFFLATLLCYLRSCTCKNGRRWFWLAVAACALALLAKPMAVSLPLVLLVLDAYPLRRRGWAVLVEKVPFVLLAAAAAVVAPLAEAKAGALMSLDQLGVTERMAQAVYGLTFYGIKTIVPTGLSPLYELPHPLNPLEARFVLSGLVVATVTLVVLAARRRRPSLLAAWTCYVVVLLPVLGFVHIGPFLVADRYTYLPMIAGSVLAAGGLHALLTRGHQQSMSSQRLIAVLAAGAVVLGAWAMLSHRQSKVWRSELTLWDHARRVDPTSPIAQGNYATALTKDGRLDEGWAAYQELMQLRPGHAVAVHGLGWVRYKQGRFLEAIRYYELVLPVMPNSAELHIDLADALAAVGRTREATDHYRRALEIWPSHARAIDALKRLAASRPASTPTSRARP